MTFLKRLWPSSTIGRIIAGTGYAFVALIIVVAAAGGGSEEPGETAQASGDSEPTATVAASGPTTTSTEEASEPTDEPEPTAEPEPTEEPEAELPSNQAQIGNLLLTVNGAAVHTEDIFAAEAGHYYVAVDITAENTSDGEYALNAFNFKLQDSEDFTRDVAITAGPEPTLGHHDMTAGQTVRAYLVFQLPEGSDPTELRYSSFTGTSGSIPVAVE